MTMWRECGEQFGSYRESLCGSVTIAEAFFFPVVSHFWAYAVALDLFREYVLMPFGRFQPCLNG